MHSTAPATPTTSATPTQNPTPRTQPHNNSRELMTLTKLYTSDKYKYKGDLLDSFDYKYTIFIDTTISQTDAQQYHQSLSDHIVWHTLTCDDDTPTSDL